mgnify:CR=1 FL=1
MMKWTWPLALSKIVGPLTISLNMHRGTLSLLLNVNSNLYNNGTLCQKPKVRQHRCAIAVRLFFL